MTNADSICFGLLAGGQSRRMGTDKAALDWRGQPLWRYQLRLAAEINAREILIAGKPDGPYRDALPPGGLVPDQLPGRGPISGIAALLTAMRSEWLVVAAVDMPFLDAAVLRQLLAARREGWGVVPIVQARAEALAAVYPRGLATLAQRHATSEDHSLQSFVRAAEAAGLVRRLPWPEEKAFRSLNTPGDWVAAKS